MSACCSCRACVEMSGKCRHWEGYLGGWSLGRGWACFLPTSCPFGMAPCPSGPSTHSPRLSLEVGISLLLLCPLGLLVERAGCVCVLWPCPYSLPLGPAFSASGFLPRAWNIFCFPLFCVCVRCTCTVFYSGQRQPSAVFQVSSFCPSFLSFRDSSCFCGQWEFPFLFWT